MHQLLMERGEIIDRLIASRRSEETGSAFRPAREADMMRRLVKRHKGILPLDTVESIWRVIISTFTYVQSPFSVHADLSAGDASMRDSARFHFGFTVPFVPHMGAAGVVAAVSTSKGDLGLVPAIAVAGAGAWWSALEFDAAPKIIARLPFVERADHPAALPVFVVSRVAADAMATEAAVWSVRVSGWGAKAAQALSTLADFIAVPDRAFDGAALLVTLPQGRQRSRRSARPWLRLAPRCVRRPSSAATQPAIRLPPTSPDRSDHANDREPTATAPRRARHCPLRSGQEHRARRRQSVQAVLQRDAVGAEPEGDRGLPGRRREA